MQQTLARVVADKTGITLHIESRGSFNGTINITPGRRVKDGWLTPGFGLLRDGDGLVVTISQPEEKAEGLWKDEEAG